MDVEVPGRFSAVSRDAIKLGFSAACFSKSPKFGCEVSTGWMVVPADWSCNDSIEPGFFSAWFSDEVGHDIIRCRTRATWKCYVLANGKGCQQNLDTGPKGEVLQP